MTCTDVDVSSLAGIEDEFAKPCEADDLNPCQHAAEWLAWVSHGSGCVEVARHVCTPCKQEAEYDWIDVLNTSRRCEVCDSRVTGQLSDNFRAIRL